jgi:hypothetical protein
MMLSYWWRLACIGLLSIGVIQIFLDIALWLASPAVARLLDRVRPRSKERAFLFAQLATHGFAFLLTALFLLPRYVRNETNLLQERVGLICIVVTAAILYRYAHGALRAVTIWSRTAYWQRRSGRPVTLASAEVPVLCVPGEGPFLAVTGLFSPSIVISRSLLVERALAPAALEVALAHENSHARNRDNLKLLLLSCLPHLNLSTARRPSVLRQWQSLAEFAADMDAVGTSRARAVLLAETLIAVARSVSPMPPRILSAALLPHEEDLEGRIQRLLGSVSSSSSSSFSSEERAVGRLASMGGAAFLVAGAIALFGLVVSSWQILAEYLLHLG